MQISSAIFNPYNSTILPGDESAKLSATTGSEKLLAHSVAQTDTDVAVFSQGNKAEIISPTLVSDEMSRLFLASQNSAAVQESSGKAYKMETNQGNIALDLDAYFADEPQKVTDPEAKITMKGDGLPPMLFPSAANIAALTEHVSERFKEMLAEYNIPAAPEQLTYDNEGQIQIPYDYAYAEELTAAFKENPGIARELQTVNALASHVAEIHARMPFVEEMQNAQSQAEIDKIIEKYGELLKDNGNYIDIALSFSDKGDMQVLADGKSV